MATKQRIVLNPVPSRVGFAGLGAPGTVQVLDTKPGTVTWLDQAKQYYKAAIALIGGLLAILPQIVVPEPAAGWVSTGIVVLTGVLTYLKANEQWVDGL